MITHDIAHRFWCRINRQLQLAVVRHARHAIRKHMATKPKGHDYGSIEWSQWQDKQASLRRFLTEETWRLNMMEGEE